MLPALLLIVVSIVKRAVRQFRERNEIHALITAVYAAVFVDIKRLIIVRAYAENAVVSAKRRAAESVSRAVAAEIVFYFMHEIHGGFAYRGDVEITRRNAAVIFSVGADAEGFNDAHGGRRVTRCKSAAVKNVSRRFGVEILHNGYTQFYIEGGQHYCPTDYSIEGDWSAAAPLLVAGAIAGEVTLQNVPLLSKQADTAICTALVRAGAELIHETDRITVRRRELRAFEFDATQCPDLFPPLAALAAACEGESVITGTSRLAHKESDRAETLREEYAKVGIEIDLSQDDTMRIRGGAIRPAVVTSHGDHRIAMSMAVSALRATGAVTIENAEAVAKSYPGFFEDLERLRVHTNEHSS